MSSSEHQLYMPPMPPDTVESWDCASGASVQYVPPPPPELEISALSLYNHADSSNSCMGSHSASNSSLGQMHSNSFHCPNLYPSSSVSVTQKQSAFLSSDIYLPPPPHTAVRDTNDNYTHTGSPLALFTPLESSTYSSNNMFGGSLDRTSSNVYLPPDPVDNENINSVEPNGNCSSPFPEFMGGHRQHFTEVTHSTSYDMFSQPETPCYEMTTSTTSKLVVHATEQQLDGSIHNRSADGAGAPLLLNTVHCQPSVDNQLSLDTSACADNDDCSLSDTYVSANSYLPPDPSCDITHDSISEFCDEVASSDNIVNVFNEEYTVPVPPNYPEPYSSLDYSDTCGSWSTAHLQNCVSVVKENVMKTEALVDDVKPVVTTDDVLGSDSDTYQLEILARSVSGTPSHINQMKSSHPPPPSSVSTMQMLSTPQGIDNRDQRPQCKQSKHNLKRNSSGGEYVLVSEPVTSCEKNAMVPVVSSSSETKLKPETHLKPTGSARQSLGTSKRCVAIACSSGAKPNGIEPCESLSDEQLRPASIVSNVSQCSQSSSTSVAKPFSNTDSPTSADLCPIANVEATVVNMTKLVISQRAALLAVINPALTCNPDRLAFLALNEHFIYLEQELNRVTHAIAVASHLRTTGLLANQSQATASTVPDEGHQKSDTNIVAGEMSNQQHKENPAIVGLQQRKFFKSQQKHSEMVSCNTANPDTHC